MVETQALLNRLKQRVLDKLYEEPYQREDGEWVDPLPAKDLALIGGLILKMHKLEQDQAKAEGQGKTIATIPAFPQIREG